MLRLALGCLFMSVANVCRGRRTRKHASVWFHARQRRECCWREGSRTRRAYPSSGIVIPSSGRGLCEPVPMWECSYVNRSFLLTRVITIFLIVGIGVSPLYASAMKGVEQLAQASSMSGMADDMPCHPSKSSSDKACPFMVACLSLCFQGMPPIVGTIVVPTTVKLRAAFQDLHKLASLAPSPPARPPRA
jgi:hypothetical protein